MASSRWKRFAFFERHTLNLPPEVLEDLNPPAVALPSLTASEPSRRAPRSTSAAAPTPADGSNSSLSEDESVRMVVTTASLPIDSKPQASTTNNKIDSSSSSSAKRGDDAIKSLEAMWSSLTACTVPEAASMDDHHNNHNKTGGGTAGHTASGASSQQLVPLPSQAQLASGTADRPLNATTMSNLLVDGLVLAFVTSRKTDLVHCIDVTLRCQSPTEPETTASSSPEWEDLDGWRGYFAPFSAVLPSLVEGSTGVDRATTSSSSSSSNIAAGTTEERIAGLAACRTAEGRIHVACISESSQVIVWEDPHLYLSCRRPLATPQAPVEATVFASVQNLSDGNGLAVDVKPGIVAVGMDTGTVLVLVYNMTEASSKRRNHLRTYLRIPPPPTVGVEVVSVKLFVGEDRASVFCSYRLKPNSNTGVSTSNNHAPPSAGVCCYELTLPGKSSSAVLSAPMARHDLDGRHVASWGLVDATSPDDASPGITVARLDGLYSYSKTERIGVAPIDGTKRTFCLVPPPALTTTTATRHASLTTNTSSSSSSYLALVASTDAKSGRDAVDVYDSTNKLVAFHLLLSPGHRAIRVGAVATHPTVCRDGTIRNGRSSALVLTSGGSLITLTEKLTAEKMSLLVQKNLYSAAIVVAYADPATDASVITSLYRQYAEHLYRKGDYGGAIDQFCHTIGSLESSYVIFRYLDAPKIPLLVRYLEKLRSRGLASPVHSELLRTCYLKLNDTEAADAIAASASSSVNKASMASIVGNLSNNPKEALSTICSLPAQQAAEILVVHGASLARALPRETAGVVVALCLGTYSPKALAEAALIDPAAVKRMIERGTDDRPRVHEPYPFHIFATSFVENPKMLRLILTHCNRNKCFLSASLRRTLLELTLAEWRYARQSGDAEAEKLRKKEALAALTDSHCRDIGDYDALVIVQQAGFEEGELLLYERLQVNQMLLERYAKDGSEKSRRQMLAMSQSDSEILAEVLGHFVKIVSEKMGEMQLLGNGDDGSEEDEADAILDDIREALALARRQGVLPPVRVTRILAGEGTGQFSAENPQERTSNRRTVPLSVALDYVGSILEESRKEILRLRSEVEEYNQLCNAMESEIDSLLRASFALPAAPKDPSEQSNEILSLSIDDMYAKVRTEDTGMADGAAVQPLESFWRDMTQSEDTFETIARYFAKGVIR